MEANNMTTTTTTKAWTHKVVKQQRGMRGQWFPYPAAYAGTEDGARQYAAAFAAEQAGVGGTEITVQTRGRAIVAVYRIA